MDGLQGLTPVAGLGGLALGVLLLVFRDVVRKAIFPKLSRAQAFRLLMTIVVLVWAASIAGIIAYVILELDDDDDDDDPPGADASNLVSDAFEAPSVVDGSRLGFKWVIVNQGPRAVDGGGSARLHLKYGTDPSEDLQSGRAIDGIPSGGSEIIAFSAGIPASFYDGKDVRVCASASFRAGTAGVESVEKCFVLRHLWTLDDKGNPVDGLVDYSRAANQPAYLGVKKEVNDYRGDPLQASTIRDALTKDSPGSPFVKSITIVGARVVVDIEPLGWYWFVWNGSRIPVAVAD